MIVKPTGILWGLALLTSVETTTAKVADLNDVAAITTQHAKVYTSSTADENHTIVEERTFSPSGVGQAVRNELQPFAGELISKGVIDLYHKRSFVLDAMRKFDSMSDVNAIDELTSISDKNFKHFVIWFGTKSPEDQDGVLDLLVAQLKGKIQIRRKLLAFIKAGSIRADEAFRMIATAVEERWLMSLSTIEMYDTLRLDYIRDDETFVRRVGHSVWKKFQNIGERKFSTFMLTKMRERSEDEVMWARLIYKLGDDETVDIPLSDVFDELLQTKAVAADGYRPTDAVEFLTSPELLNVYNDVERTSKEVGAAVVEKLLTLSKDELMWARLIYILQNDETVPTIPSSVFDNLLQPYEITVQGEDLCKPSQAVKYLAGPELSRTDSRLFTGHEFDGQVLKELLKKSHDELMWAKLLYMLRNDKTVSPPLSGVLRTIISSWTEKPYKSAPIAQEFPFSICKEILMHPNFHELHLYAQFSSDNPDVFVLEKLRERWADDFVWAQALSALRKDHNVLTPLSGVLDALLHSWIGKPYHEAAPSENHPALIGAYELLLNHVVTAGNEHRPTTFLQAKALVEVLLKWSNDELLWAKFLFKLQQDEGFAAVASSAFDVLLQSDNAAQTAVRNSPCSIVMYLQSSSFLDMYKYVQLTDNADASLWVHILTLSPDQVVWAKAFYMLQDGERESSQIFRRLLETLLIWWTHGAVEVAEPPNPFVESKNYLKSQNFANLISYARFSSDRPDAFVVQKLRERSTNDFMWARLLNELRKEYMKLHEEGYQLQKEIYALSGVLSAFLHSWSGKPYDAAAVSEDKGILIAAYDLLTSREFADWYEGSMKSNEENADKATLDRLLKTSNDDVMWAKFLNKLKEDSALDFSLSGVLQTLLQTW